MESSSTSTNSTKNGEKRMLVGWMITDKEGQWTHTGGARETDRQKDKFSIRKEVFE